MKTLVISSDDRLLEKLLSKLEDEPTRKSPRLFHCQVVKISCLPSLPKNITQTIAPPPLYNLCTTVEHLLFCELTVVMHRFDTLISCRPLAKLRVGLTEYLEPSWQMSC